MGVNIYLFVSSFITLQTSKSNFYLRVIVKVNINIWILFNVYQGVQIFRQIQRLLSVEEIGNDLKVE